MSTRKQTTLTKLRDFFTENPDEWLTREDAMEKFECGSSTLWTATAQLRREGVVRSQTVLTGQEPKSPRLGEAT